MRIRRLVHATGAVLLSLTCGTQLCAWQMSYHPALGRPLARLGVHQLYAPWAVGQWAWRWGRKYPRVFHLPAMVTGGSLLLLCLPLARRRTEAHEGARWATTKDLKAAGLFAPQGVVLGKHGNRVVRHHGPEHVLCVGPSRSGKGVSHVIPTLFDWRASVFVFDPKDELYALTAAARRQCSRVIRLHPTAQDSARLNPLDAIRLGTVHELRDTALIASILTDPDGEGDHGGASQHFREMATELLTGLILYGLSTKTATSLAALNNLLTLDQPFEQLIATLHKEPHPAIRRAATLARELADREQSGVVSTTRRALRLFSDPLVARMTETSDFLWCDLRERVHPMTVYLSIPFADQERLRPLSRLIVRQMFDYCTHKLTGWRHRLLVLLDEVAALKRMPILAEGLEYLAGYGITLCLVTPSLTPLEALYGTRNGFWEGCRVRLVFAPNSAAIAQLFARETGEAMVEKHRVMVAREPFQALRDRTSTSTETVREPLLSATALMQLDQDQVLLLVGNSHPARLTKARYYEHKTWLALSQLSPQEHDHAHA